MKIDELQSVASKIRARTISNSHLTQTPHLGSCLSCVDFLVAVYFHGLRIDPRNPTDPDRDRFIHRVRRHARLKYLSPIDFERQFYEMKQAA